MAKNPKTKRTQIHALPVAAQELKTDQAQKVKGGAPIALQIGAGDEPVRMPKPPKL